jgi:hypothetical protein
MRDATSGTGTAYNTSGAPKFNLIFSGVHTVPDLPICLAVWNLGPQNLGDIWLKV